MHPISPAQANHVRFSANTEEPDPQKSLWSRAKEAFQMVGQFLLNLFTRFKQWGQDHVVPFFTTSIISPPTPEVQDDWPMGKLNTAQVFGPDPSRITLRQQGGNTCYLLSALASLLHHPQCQAILSQIGFEKTGDGYIVTFPGQPEPITVHKRDFRHNGVQSDNLGIRLLEAAHFKIPDPQIQWGRFDNTHRALRRIFGDRLVVPTAQSVQDYVPIQQSFQLGTLLTTEADVWTATKRIKNTANQPIATGSHYYAIRPVPEQPQHVQLVDPFNTGRIVETLTIEQLNEQYQTEMTRIRLEQEAA